MAFPTSNPRLQLRRGSTADWQLRNPILLPGEPAYDTTEKKIKIGDGVTQWSLLPYVAGGGAGGAGLDTAIDDVGEGDVLRYSDGKWRNYGEQQLTDGGNF